jgi:hypothetical protein
MQKVAYAQQPWLKRPRQNKLLLLLLLLLQITKLEVEAGGGLTCSAADNILALL